MIKITWQGQDTPPLMVTESFREKLTNFILKKVAGLMAEIEQEQGSFDITDADNPEQLAIMPKNFSPDLTKKIIRSFSE